jgi:hypothetical protein
MSEKAPAEDTQRVAQGFMVSPVQSCGFREIETVKMSLAKKLDLMVLVFLA